MLRKVLPLVVLALVAGLLFFFSTDSAESPPSPPVAPEPTRTEQLAPPPASTEPRARVDLPSPPPDAGVDASTPPEPDAGGSPPPADGGGSSTPPVDGGDPSTPLGAAPTPPSFTIDAGAPAKNDPRFTIRWGQPGLCGEEPLERLAQRRASLLSTFIGVRRAGTTVFHDRDADPAFADVVGDSLAQARIIVTRLLGPRADVALPVIYVYATGEQMRDVACVNTATQGYYDGAIHLPATDPDAYRTIVHEHVHHVLNTFGLRKPMWLHEGLAMYAADERWWEDPRLGLTAWLRGKHLPFPALVEAFPHTADELFAGAAYYQSYQMVSFLAARSGRSDFSWLVDGLVSGTLTAQTCFGDSVGLPADQLESAWGAFIQAR